MKLFIYAYIDMNAFALTKHAIEKGKTFDFNNVEIVHKD